mmetsp:Transcript_47941/g.48816  ORF Transcript_47941/g.48816 Transcript_47941/m.48816 type:complete len:81 (-) Transcript_47941:742-984(-)
MTAYNEELVDFLLVDRKITTINVYIKCNIFGVTKSTFLKMLKIHTRCFCCCCQISVLIEKKMYDHENAINSPSYNTISSF